MMINLYIALAAMIVLPTIFALGYYGGMKTKIDGLEAAQNSDDTEPHPILRTDQYKVQLDDLDDEEGRENGDEEDS